MALSAEEALRYTRSNTQPTYTPPTAAPTTAQQVVRKVSQVNDAINKVPVLGQAKRVATAGLGAVGKILNKPSEITEKVLTGGSTYEKRYGAPKWAGTAARMVLDPLNFISLGGSSFAKVSLKQLGKKTLKSLGKEGLEKVAQVAGKEGVINFSKEAGKELAKLEAKAGRKAALRVMVNRVAKEGREKLIEKTGINIGVPLTKIKKTIPIPNLATKISPALSKVNNIIPEKVKSAARSFQYPLKRAPEGAEDIVDTFTAQKQKLFEMGDTFTRNYQKAPPEVRALADDVLRGITQPNNSHPVIEAAGIMRNTIDDLGKKAVDLKIISKETYKAGQGKYLPQLYKVFLENDDLVRGAPEAKRIAAEEFGRTQMRTLKEIDTALASGEITPEVATAMRNKFERFQKAGGQVTNPAFLASKAVQNVGGLVTKTDQFKQMKRFGKNAADLGEEYLKGNVNVKLPKGLVGDAESELQRHMTDITELAKAKGKEVDDVVAKSQAAQRLISESIEINHKGEKLYRLPDSQGLGAMSGLYVPEGIHTFLTEGSGKFLSTDAGKWMIRLSAPFNFKSAKTVLSPGSQVRNILSNQILGFLQDPGSFKHFKEAYQITKNPTSPAYQEMQKVGLFAGKFFGEEVAKFYNKIDDLSKLDDQSMLTTFYNFAGEFYNKAGNFRDFSENMAKVQQYLRARSLGASPQQAKKVAETALFAYHKVGPSVRILRSSAIPFLTFTIKAAPFVAKQGLKTPGRLAVFPKAEREFLNLFGAKEEEYKYLPDYMKGMLPLPIKDERGNTLYYNPKYIYPWGGLAADDVQPLPGLPFIGKGGSLPGGVSLSPTFSETASQISGRDLFTGEEFVRESQTTGDQVRARVEHAAKTFTPSPVSSVIPFIPGATSTTRSQRNRGLSKSLLGAFTGIQTQPFNISEGRAAQNEAIEAVRRQTTTEVNRAIREKKSKEYIRSIRMKGLERIRKLRQK